MIRDRVFWFAEGILLAANMAIVVVVVAIICGTVVAVLIAHSLFLRPPPELTQLEKDHEQDRRESER